MYADVNANPINPLILYVYICKQFVYKTYTQHAPQGG
jgi:hypothetical protein